MNILIIGNGFDLAHGLPTKYTDFVQFCKRVNLIFSYYDDSDFEHYKKTHLDNWKFDEQIKEVLENTYKTRKIIKLENDGYKIEIDDSVLNEIYQHIKDNFWIDYFTQFNKNENWIDFEKEISQIVQDIDKDMQGKNFYGQIDFLSNKYLDMKFLYPIIASLLSDKNGDKMEYKQITYQELRDKLHKDLGRLIRALEIYLTQYVENKDIKVISPDIKEIAIQINHNKHTALPAKVISFNYTNTFQKLYGKSKRIEYDYIHGKADIDNTIETNNMVLGIDEYLSDDRRNKDIEFIAFKKFYQRIYKETGCKYKEWVDIIKDELEDSYISLNNHIGQNKTLLKKQMKYYEEKHINKHNIYIFGHSLDVTDKDILRDLILNDNVYTTIFYLNKSVMGQQIANLVKVIGQDELIKRTGGSTKTIEFKQQRDMVKID